MRTLIRLFVAALIVLGVVILIWFATRYQQARVENTEIATVNTRLILYCVRYRLDLALEESVCSGQWWQDSQTDEILNCHQLSPVLEVPFNSCLQQEGITPPSE